MDQAANTVNRILDTISQRCSQGMDIRDYFHIGILSYSTDGRGTPRITSILPETTSGQPFLSISQGVDATTIEERVVKECAGGLGEVTQRVPVWLRPDAGYGTPMLKALQVAADALEVWIGEHPDSFPPIVINISDGAATDGDPEREAQRIMALETSDGNVLVFNVHLSGAAARPLQYPDGEDVLPQGDEYALTMFRMSSVLPKSSRNHAIRQDLLVNENSRGYVFNADMTALGPIPGHWHPRRVEPALNRPATITPPEGSDAFATTQSILYPQGG